MTIVGPHDFVKVSISALLRSFLLIMCIDAPESTTNSLSQVSKMMQVGTYFPETRRICSFMLFQFLHIFGQFPLCHTVLNILVQRRLPHQCHLVCHEGWHFSRFRLGQLPDEVHGLVAPSAARLQNHHHETARPTSSPCRPVLAT